MFNKEADYGLPPGPRTDVDFFNSLLFNDGIGLAPLALDRMILRNPETMRPTLGPQQSIRDSQITRQLGNWLTVSVSISKT